jgi:hypothetical protein
VATFTASVPLNLTFRHTPTGAVVTIRQSIGVPLPAGTPFDVPDSIADAFQSDMQDPPDQVPTPNSWAGITGYWWLSPGPLPVPGRIPGLTRL